MQWPALLLTIGVCCLTAGCARGGQAAQSGAAAAASSRPVFDGGAAYTVLKKQCDFGPRPVGSDAHAKTRDYLLAEMGKYADKTVAQDFTYQGMPLTNVIGIFRPDAPRQVLVCAHWDTRPTADQEINPARRKKPIPGANDGASGVAVLLQLARMFKQQKPDVGVVLVCLDGEDYGDFEKDKGVFLGSRYFATHHDGYRLQSGILLDMVGDKNLTIYREANSQDLAPGMNERVFGTARQLGFGSNFVDKTGEAILDDHIALSRGGIPTIDLIDFDYGPWHTLDDTPDKCSADSLRIVGTVVASVLYGEPAR